MGEKRTLRQATSEFNTRDLGEMSKPPEDRHHKQPVQSASPIQAGCQVPR